MAWDRGRRGVRSDACCLVVLLGLSSVACQEAKAERVTPKPAPSSATEIVASVLGGEIRGAAFTLKNARYTIDRRHGFEKIDVSLSSASADSPCGERKPKDSPSVWLRRSGPEALTKQQVRLSPGDESPWEVHYQVRDGRAWLGNGRASALIVIDRVESDLKLIGELWACFGDEHASCVAGRFSADYCPIRIDSPVRGIEAMERPPPATNPAPVNTP